MQKIKLLKRMASPDGNYPPGFVMDVDIDRGQQLVDQKAAIWLTPVRQAPIEQAVEPSEEKAVYLGGGYYKLPNGDKVRGKKAADKAMKR